MNRLPELTSVKRITSKDVIPTSGSEPLKVLCSDGFYYVVKYPSPDAGMLIREFIAHFFLMEWEIVTPMNAIVRIDSSHIDSSILSSRRNNGHFTVPCLGSRWLSDSEELKPSFLHRSTSDLKHIQREDFLRIALFDLWIGNEDRTDHNPNLLLLAGESDPDRFAAIDHTMIFNSGITAHPIAPLAFEDSLLSSRYLKTLFRWSKKTEKIFEETTQELVYFVQKCERCLPTVLANIPSEWRLDEQRFEEWAKDNLFQPSWLTEVETTFKTYITQAYQKR